MAQSPKNQVKELLDYIDALEAQVAQQESTIAARDASIVTLSIAVQARDQVILDLRASNEALQAALEACQNSHPAPPDPVPVDAVLGEKVYSAWSECVNGQQTRTWTRAIITPAQNGGATGETSGTETQGCTMPPPPPPPPPPAGDIAFTWSALPNTKMRPAIAVPRPGEMWGSRGPDAVTEAWNHAVVVEDVDGVPAFAWPWTGGHGDWFGSHFYALRDEPGAVWVNRTPESAPYTTEDRSAYVMPNGDLRPSSRHTYQGVQWLPNIKKIWSAGGSIWRSGFYDRGVFLFSLATGKVERLQDLPMASEVASVYDPVTGHVIYTLQGSAQIYEHDPVADTHTRIGLIPASRNAPPSKWSADYTSNVMLGLYGRELWAFKGLGWGPDIDVLTFQLPGGPGVDWQPRKIAGYENWWYPSVDWDEALKRFVLWGGPRTAGQGAVQIIDPVTNTAQIIPGGGERSANGTVGKFRRMPSGKYWFCRDIDEDVLVWGPTTDPVPAPDPEPEPTPDPIPDPVPDPAPDPVPDPTPEPTPTPSALRYRYQQPKLFQPPSLIEGIPSPESASSTGDVISNGWPWDRRGGDWIDADGVRYGPKPVASGPMNMSQSGVHTYDMTAAIKQAKGRHCAFLLNVAAPNYRKIGGRYSTTPPRLDVTYTDGSKETWPCWYTCFVTNAPADKPTVPPGQALDPQPAFPLFLEWDRKSDNDIQSATMTLTVARYYTETAQLQVFTLDPPINEHPVEQGVASTVGALDEGLEAKVIGLQRYLDGRPHSDFVATGLSTAMMNHSGEYAYDPFIWDETKPHDFTKFPHIHVNKWQNAGGNWTKVESTYQGDGFYPLAPGLGAMRVVMKKEAPPPGGTAPRTGASSAANAVISLPEPLFGRLKRIFVRYYYMLAPYSTVGSQYPIVQDGITYWIDNGGKALITPHHQTTWGSGTSSAGGNLGWIERNAWDDPIADGPDSGGCYAGIHQDLATNNPVNYEATDRAQDVSFGQQGGLGSTLYHGHWYCIEEMIDLNTVMMEAPGYKLDGAIKVWIDGRLALQRSGMVFRRLPIFVPERYDPMTAKRPCRELGHAGLLWVWYHGGLTPSSIERVAFVTGLAWGPDYIGPMKGL